MEGLIAVASPPRLLAGRLLSGCNVHHRTTVFVQRVSPGALESLTVVDAGPDFAERFAERFGAPARAQEPGLPLTRLLLEAILAVERIAADAMGRCDEPAFGAVIPGTDVVDLVWSAHKAWISRAAARVAFAGLVELLPGTRPISPKGFATQLAALRRRALRRQWSRVAAVLSRAARRRGVTHELLAGNYLRVGEGIHQVVVSEATLGLSPEDAVSMDDAALLDQVFPNGAPAAVPTVLVLGERGTRAVARRLDRVLRATRDGVRLGLGGKGGGTTIQGRPQDPTAHGRRNELRSILRDPRVGTAVSAMAPRRVVTRGLGLDRLDLLALLDPVPGGDLEAYGAAVRVCLKAIGTAGAVVIGSDNPCAELVLASVDARRMFLATRRRKAPLGRRHASAGGCVVRFKRGEDRRAIELRRGSRRVAQLRAERRDLRALIAAGAAFALGIQ